jgi:hypothetical protein
LLLAARRHHRQIVGSHVDADGDEDSDKAEPESPVVMRTPPIRGFAVMAMVTLSVGMGVFGVVHSHADLREKHPQLRKNVTMSDHFKVLSESEFPRLEPAWFPVAALG